MVRVLKKRFSELTVQLEAVGASRQVKHSEMTGSHEIVDDELLLNWCVKARNLISSACGKDSEHYTSFAEAEKPKNWGSSYGVFKRVKAVFMAAQEDFEGGYLGKVRNLVQAEIADSELDQSRELLRSGYVAAAAVVAGVILETTLRTLCERHAIATGKLDKMNADLVKAGEYNVLVQKRVTALAAIRNSAAHGNSNEFGLADVESMIAEIERFAQEALS
ncbi:DUF4145 domain-containing protein [Xanthomonas hortorum]|uniref:DUF4145 domain-containing protein n=3 Tax=Xanthomonas TaxID=338 RepID=A0AAX0A1H3_9XANT|nr:DUF4145 domain-containing protein [Xanthomonas hortorum]MCE4356654.1 hypothetical protein [Xanthomonas hortorum pv. pelargonii]MCM5526747.1 hypothetical protein [Xanthomonas hortorum pv. pelargonii]MCM5538668.1 hypothetical protein [Xanthomonas hortorum pv. pelargonii]MCM5542891.1 hypothetical protein [Xanthomonas hortorum pv. pelargonii]MCM5547118.1 hypothetical protein [Xanthomonas hortorum pv. pelargonii]